MKVRIVKSFGGYKVGREFDWGDGMCRVLIARGLVEPVSEQSVETAAVESRAEKAVQPNQKRRPK